MKPLKLKIPFAARVVLLILGLGSAWLPLNAIRTGRIDAGDHGVRIDISRTQDPVFFWTLVFIFFCFSAAFLFGSFVKRKTDA